MGRTRGAEPWVHYEGGEGPGAGKHIVLISGDEEYRSEEALPQLAKILATEHGFDCTVLFAIDPKTGLVDPNYRQNIPGLNALKTADLMIIFMRRRDLPDDQMQLIDDYLKAGKPVFGIRTATHAFLPAPNSKWAYYGDTYAGPIKDWEGGFGRVVLGETWVNHHGNHKNESTRGIIAPGAANNPILRGIKNGEIWCSTDVYAVRLPLPGDSQPLVLGEVTARKGPFDPNDRFYGMRPDDGPAVSGPKNNPDDARGVGENVCDSRRQSWESIRNHNGRLGRSAERSHAATIRERGLLVRRNGGQDSEGGRAGRSRRQV